LKYIGSATTTAVTLGGSGIFIYNVAGLHVDANNLAANAVLVADLSNSEIFSLRGGNASTRNIWVKGGNTSTFYKPGSFGDITAQYGMVIDADATGVFAFNHLIIAPHLEGTTSGGAGLYFHSSGNITVLGGFSETNVGAGVLVGSSPINVDINIIGLDTENNGTYDYDLASNRSKILASSSSTNTFKVRSGATENIISGNIGGTVVFDSGSYGNTVQDAFLAALPTINGTTTYLRNVQVANVVVSDTVPITRQCEIVISGTGVAGALQAGDDTPSVNSCFNNTGVSWTPVALYCKGDAASDTNTVSPAFGAMGTGSGLLNAPITCGNSNAYSTTATGCGGSACVLQYGSIPSGNGISPVMGGTPAGTNIHVLFVYKSGS
jgi:hypothetical protein